MKFALGVLAVIILSGTPVSAQSFIQTSNPQTDNQGSLQGSGGVLQGSSPQSMVLGISDIYSGSGNTDNLTVEQNGQQSQPDSSSGLLTEEQKTQNNQSQIYPWLIAIGIAILGLGLISVLRRIGGGSSSGNTFVN